MFRPVTQTMQTCAPAVLKGAPFLLTPTSSTYHLVPRFEIEDTGVITYVGTLPPSLPSFFQPLTNTEQCQTRHRRRPSSRYPERDGRPILGPRDPTPCYVRDRPRGADFYEPSAILVAARRNCQCLSGSTIPVTSGGSRWNYSVLVGLMACMVTISPSRGFPTPVAMHYAPLDAHKGCIVKSSSRLK